jgi:hypothetical protein
MRTTPWQQFLMVALLGVVGGAVGVLIAMRGQEIRTPAPTPTIVVPSRPSATIPAATATERPLSDAIPSAPVPTPTASAQTSPTRVPAPTCDGDCWVYDESARRLTWIGPGDGTVDVWQRPGTPHHRQAQAGATAVFVAGVPMRIEICLGAINGRPITSDCEPDLFNLAPGRYEITSPGPRGGFRATRRPEPVVANCPDYRPTTPGRTVTMAIDVPAGEVAFVDAWGFDDVSTGVFVRIRGPHRGQHTIADGSYCGGIDMRKDFAPVEQQRRSYFKGAYREITCSQGRCSPRPEGTTDFLLPPAAREPAATAATLPPTPVTCPTVAAVRQVTGVAVERLDQEPCAFVGQPPARGPARCPRGYICTFALDRHGIVLVHVR